MDSDNGKYHDNEHQPAGDTTQDFAQVAKQNVSDFGRSIKVAIERVTGKDADPSNPTTQGSGYAKN